MKPISLNECMAEFTKEELLDGADTIYCSKCKEHQPTKKQLSVYSLPEV
jgi:ubiquitin carboxyl-terminal hydrolase 4/11/15